MAYNKIWKYKNSKCSTPTAQVLKNTVSLTGVGALASTRIFSTKPKPLWCHREERGSEERQSDASSSHPDARHGGTGAVRSRGAEFGTLCWKSSCANDVFTITPLQLPLSIRCSSKIHDGIHRESRGSLFAVCAMIWSSRSLSLTSWRNTGTDGDTGIQWFSVTYLCRTCELSVRNTLLSSHI